MFFNKPPTSFSSWLPPIIEILKAFFYADKMLT